MIHSPSHSNITVGKYLVSPLTRQLDDGRFVHGFLCESHALAGARDISHFGGWRAYLASL